MCISIVHSQLCIFQRPSWRQRSSYSWFDTSWSFIHGEERYICEYRGQSTANATSCYTTRPSQRRLENCQSSIWGKCKYLLFYGLPALFVKTQKKSNLGHNYLILLPKALRLNPYWEYSTPVVKLTLKSKCCEPCQNTKSYQMIQYCILCTIYYVMCFNCIVDMWYYITLRHID